MYEELVTSERLATHFKVAVVTIRRWVRDEIIPCVRPFRRIVRFRIKDVEEALTKRLATVVSES